MPASGTRKGGSRKTGSRNTTKKTTKKKGKKHTPASPDTQVRNSLRRVDVTKLRFPALDTGCPQRVIVTGIPGSDKGSLLRDVATRAQAEGHPTRLLEVGQAMYQAYPEIRPDGILELDTLTLEAMRRHVQMDWLYKRAIEDLNGEEHCLVNSHLFFPETDRGALDPEFVRLLQPTGFATVVRGIHDLQADINVNHSAIGANIFETIQLRHSEVVGTRTIAHFLDRPFVQIPRGTMDQHPALVDLVYKLIYEPWRPVIYFQFPITDLVGPDGKLIQIGQQIIAIRDALRKHFVVFDPLDVEEFYITLRARIAAEAGEKSFVIDTPHGGLEIEVPKAAILHHWIDRQIRLRDFLQVICSDMTVALIPEVDGRPARSSGVEQELAFAARRTVPRLVVSPFPGKLPSPFTNMATAVVDSYSKMVPTIADLIARGLVSPRGGRFPLVTAA